MKTQAEINQMHDEAVADIRRRSERMSDAEARNLWEAFCRHYDAQFARATENNKIAYPSPIPDMYGDPRTFAAAVVLGHCSLLDLE